MIHSSNKSQNTKQTITLYTSSPEQTEELGHIIGKCLHAGSKLALIGDLATGKTCLVQGIVKELCGNCWIHSPTFTIMNQYGTSPVILHLDCYRIQDEREIIDIGSEEWLNDDSICLIEWADRITNIIPPDTIYMYLYHINNDKRKIQITDPESQIIDKLINLLPPIFLNNEL